MASFNDAVERFDDLLGTSSTLEIETKIYPFVEADLVLIGLKQVVEGGQLVRGGVDQFLVFDPVEKVQHAVKLKNDVRSSCYASLKINHSRQLHIR